MLPGSVVPVAIRSNNVVQCLRGNLDDQPSSLFCSSTYCCSKCCVRVHSFWRNSTLDETVIWQCEVWVQVWSGVWFEECVGVAQWAGASCVIPWIDGLCSVLVQDGTWSHMFTQCNQLHHVVERIVIPLLGIISTTVCIQSVISKPKALTPKKKKHSNSLNRITQKTIDNRKEKLLADLKNRIKYLL